MANEQHRLKPIARVVPRVLAVLLAGVLVSKWVLLNIAWTSAPWSAAGFMALLFVGLTVASAAGLLLLRNWGFFGVYLLAPFSTIFHGIALVPWITSALPTLEQRIWAVGVLNALFLFAAAMAHWSLDRAVAPLAERRLV